MKSMGTFTPLELKILIGSILTAIASPVDVIIKFLIPIISGIVWVFLKPYVEKWRMDLKNRRRKNGNKPL